MKLTQEEQKVLQEYLQPYLSHEQVQKMDQYLQHGKVSTLEHCRNVARFSFWLNRRLHLGADEKVLCAGALLHDFYLYDWHEDGDGTHRLHGFTHPGHASRNARRIFGLGEKERKVIESHMWPLTLRAFPGSREAAIVCFADKYCSAWETLFMRKKGGRPICG